MNGQRAQQSFGSLVISHSLLILYFSQEKWEMPQPFRRDSHGPETLVSPSDSTNIYLKHKYISFFTSLLEYIEENMFHFIPTF
jgi:hypothetical protein